METPEARADIHMHFTHMNQPVNQSPFGVHIILKHTFISIMVYSHCQWYWEYTSPLCCLANILLLLKLNSTQLLNIIQKKDVLDLTSDHNLDISLLWTFIQILPVLCGKLAQSLWCLCQGVAVLAAPQVICSTFSPFATMTYCYETVYP